MSRRSHPAVRMTWRTYLVGEDDRVTVYWFPREPDWRTGYVAKALGVGGLWREYVEVIGTSDEIAGWTAAATAYVDEVALAAAELNRVQWRTWRWRGRPVVRRWADAKYNEVKVSYLDRVRTAASEYQPVRDIVEQRIAEQEAVRRAAADRAERKWARRQREAEARFRAWERRQAVADRRLPGGLTPRQMAARGDDPASWPPEVEATVGDLVTWWAGVSASVRNEQARAEAVRKVIETITATAAALEDAGRPGIEAVDDKPREVLHGWWLDFDWPDVPDAAPLRTPPGVPVDHLPPGTWHYDLYLPGRMLFTSIRSGNYHFATVTTERIGGSDYVRPAWWVRDIEEFTESLFPAWITYRTDFFTTDPAKEVRVPITDHADPAVFVPYVNAVARCAVAMFRDLTRPARWT